ncbi:hypothetical protein PKOR_01970 [Pontibacter korlensis]|uniref:Uncharacterized protein n=1 Tax=Pontibacter korlensis TaxID=400092 RepID=A0A0E3ZBY8_9BACT|nr:hypothetical protein [Pontibacter korlensis]AKD02129.1 hypothetical protein PKOR_01970 [Pontibacter korlensis]
MDTVFDHPVAKVTNYTYQPLVGIMFHTDPDGHTPHFKYARLVLRRLQAAKDEAGGVLQSYEYYYRK